MVYLQFIWLYLSLKLHSFFTNFEKKNHFVVEGFSFGVSNDMNFQIFPERAISLVNYNMVSKIWDYVYW